MPRDLDVRGEEGTQRRARKGGDTRADAWQWTWPDSHARSRPLAATATLHVPGMYRCVRACFDLCFLTDLSQ